MCQIIYEGEIEFSGHRFRINNPPAGKGSFVRILSKIFFQLNAMHSHHSKVFVCMQIYHLHDYTPDNKLFSDFMHKYKKRLAQKFDLKRISYVWIREHASGDAQHYHLALFLDGNKIRQHHDVFQLAEEIWIGWNQPRPAFPPDVSYYNLSRNDWPEIHKALYHLSYMAKVHTKEKRPMTTNRYEGSRIKPAPE